MAARYALQQFIYHDTVAGADITILEGAQRDSLSQAVSQSPASYWSSSPLASGTQIDPRLAGYLTAYPNA